MPNGPGRSLSDGRPATGIGRRGTTSWARPPSASTETPRSSGRPACERCSGCGGTSTGSTSRRVTRATAARAFGYAPEPQGIVDPRTMERDGAVCERAASGSTATTPGGRPSPSTRGRGSRPTASRPWSRRGGPRSAFAPWRSPVCSRPSRCGRWGSIRSCSSWATRGRPRPPAPAGDTASSGPTMCSSGPGSSSTPTSRFTDASFSDEDPAGDRDSGSAGSGGIARRHHGRTGRGSSGSLRLRHFGARPLVEDDQVRSEPTTLVNLQAGYRDHATPAARRRRVQPVRCRAQRHRLLLCLTAPWRASGWRRGRSLPPYGAEDPADGAAGWFLDST